MPPSVLGVFRSRGLGRCLPKVDIFRMLYRKLFFFRGITMFNRLKASWMLTKACFAVLKKDKELMMFPVFCGILTILGTIAFAVPGYALASSDMTEDGMNLAFGALGITYSFVTYSIVLFFNVAVLSCAKIRFEGGDPTLADGFKAGRDNLGVIFSWAAVGGVVSFIIRQLEQSFGVFGSIVAKLIGGAFAVVSYFAIPVMIFEKVGPSAAFTRSKEIIKKTWGEALGAYLGFSVITTIAAWTIIFSLVGTGIMSISMGTYVPFTIGGVVSLAAFLLAAIVTSCLSQIFQAALYIYATTGEIPTEIGNDMVEQAFQSKKGSKWVLTGSNSN